MLVRIAATIALSLLLISCLPSLQAQQSHSMAIWNDYGDLANLARRADLIVEGRVIARIGSREVRGYPEQRTPIAYTESSVEIRNVLKGIAPSSTMRVFQIGREGDPAQHYPEFPVLRPGTEVILFLVDATATSVYTEGAARYSIIAPVGILQIEAGRLRSSAAEYESAAEALRLDLDQFRVRIRRIAAN